MVGQITEAGLFTDVFTEAGEAVSESAAVALQRLIQIEKEKAIADARRQLIPTVIGIGAASGAIAGLAVWLLTRHGKP